MILVHGKKKTTLHERNWNFLDWLQIRQLLNDYAQAYWHWQSTKWQLSWTACHFTNIGQQLNRLLTDRWKWPLWTNVARYAHFQYIPIEVIFECVHDVCFLKHEWTDITYVGTVPKDSIHVKKMLWLYISKWEHNDLDMNQSEQIFIYHNINA